MARKRTLAQRRAEFRKNAAKFKKQERKKNIKKTAKSVGKALATEAAMAAVPALRAGKVVKAVSKFAKGRKAAAKATKKAKRNLKYEKDMRSAQKKTTAKIDTESKRTNIQQSRKEKQEARRMQSAARKSAMKGKYEKGRFYNTIAKARQQSADRLAKRKGPPRMTPPASKKYASDVVMDTGRKVVRAKKAVKKAQSTERKVNRLADLGDHIAARAALLKRKRSNRNEFLNPKKSKN